jgi:M6 family metalloprotease-like protein
MKRSTQRHLLRNTLLLASVSLVTTDAQALIVWNGQIVSAWPEEARPGVAAFMSGGDSFYRAPKGETLGLTLLVDFSDQAPAFTAEEIGAWLDGLNYTEDNRNGGVRDYYLDVSNGLLDLRNEVFGFYRAQHPKSHYEVGPGYAGASELVAEMIEAFDDMVDFSRYDNDGDGSTDAVSIIYAGPSETFGQGLWPHAGGTNHNADGVRIGRYMMTQLGNDLDTYVFAHETGHMLFDWPDLYGFGDYCIMGNRISTLNPVGVNDFFRADQNWIPVVDVDMEVPALYVARPNGAAYRFVNPNEPDELFLWSNVQNAGRFAPLEGGGLLLLHYDRRRRTNDPPNPLALAVVQADGLNELDDTTWPMPGNDPDDYFFDGNNTEFSDTTHPSAAWNDGADSGLRIHAVSENGPRMTFAVGEGEAPTTPEPEPAPVGTAGGGVAGGSSGAGGNGGAGGSAAEVLDAGVEPAGEGGAASIGGSPATGVAGSAGASGMVNSAGAPSGGVGGKAAGGSSTTEPSAPTAGPASGGSAAGDVGSGPAPSSAPATTAPPVLMPAAPPSASAPLASVDSDTDGGGCACRLKTGSVPSTPFVLLPFAIALLSRRRR